MKQIAPRVVNTGTRLSCRQTVVAEEPSLANTDQWGPAVKTSHGGAMTPLRVTQPALNLLSKQLRMRGLSATGQASDELEIHW